jgi:hypothetical protein
MKMLAKHDSRDQLEVITLNQLVPQMQLINSLMLHYNQTFQLITKQMFHARKLWKSNDIGGIRNDVI